MEPKEKAKELFDKMKGFRVKHSHSKKCALIAVDEILDVSKIELGMDSSSHDVVIFATTRIIFWQEVKKEIELL